MEHPEKIIPLNFIRKDFEEIYYSNKQDNIFLSPSVKSELIKFFIALLLLFITITYCLLTDQNQWLIAVLIIFTILSFIPYYSKALQILKWRKEVKAFKKKNEQFKTHKLVLTEGFFLLIQDDNEDIHKWSAFTHLEINNDYLVLTGTSQYFIPKKSMLPEDYEYLVQEIKTRMNND